MEIAVAATVCVLIAVLSPDKGYNVALWFFAARFIILIVLALAASVRKDPLPADPPNERGTVNGLCRVDR
jgi:hypothetical protein